MTLADYLDASISPEDARALGLAPGLGRGGGGGHRGGGGGGGHWGGRGWGGGWGGGWWPGYYQQEPYVIEVETAPRLLFAPIRPGDAWPGCAWAGVGLQRCGNTVAYDTTRYEERGGRLYARGAPRPVNLGAFPVLAPSTFTPLRPLTFSPSIFAPTFRLQTGPVCADGTVLPVGSDALVGCKNHGGYTSPAQQFTCNDGAVVSDPVSCAQHGGYSPPSAPAPAPTFRVDLPSPTAPPAQTCPPGATYDATSSPPACVCAAGTMPNATGTACVTVGGGAGGAPAVPSDGTGKWLAFAALMFAAYRVLK